jgi:peptidyl-tRNA hydrolase
MKMVIVVDRNIETGKLANAIAHCSQGINVDKHDEYSTSNGITCTLSNHPIVIVAAKNANQVKKALVSADEAKLVYSFFSSTMWRDTPEEQVEATKATNFDALEIIACAIYGGSTEVNNITKRFSLFK